MEQGKSIKKRHGLAIKLIVAIIVIVAVVSVASVWVGRSLYWDDITRHYDTVTKQVAVAVQGMFTQQEIDEWGDLAVRSVHGEDVTKQIEEITSSERYKTLKDLTENLRKSINANDIYVISYDTSVLDDYKPGVEDKENKELYGTWLPFCYIMDTYLVPEEQYPMGAGSLCDPTMRYEMADLYNKGEDPTDIVITYFNNQYILSGLHMVASDGKGKAIIGVEMPIPTLEGDLSNFVWKIVLVDLAVMAGLILIFTAATVLWIVRPIRRVASEAAQFVGDNANVSQVLGKIKTHDEIQTLSESLLSLEYGIREYIDNLTEVTAEKERYQTELNVAAKMQADMLPTEFDLGSGLSLYATMTPAKEMGGDFYDFFAIDDDHVAIVMADVSGKGIPAALFMVIARTLLKNRTLSAPGTPAEIFADVNNALCVDNPSGLFVTVWMAIITMSTGEMVCANAGHEYPAILHQGGEYTVNTVDNLPPLATMEDLEYEDETIQLQKGDRIFLYTDGVPEAKNGEGKKLGVDEMLAMLNRGKESSPEDLLTDIKSELDNYAAGVDPFDDITMMSMIWNGK